MTKKKHRNELLVMSMTFENEDFLRQAFIGGEKYVICLDASTSITVDQLIECLFSLEWVVPVIPGGPKGCQC